MGRSQNNDFYGWCALNRDHLLTKYAPLERHPANSVFRILKRLGFTVENAQLPLGRRGQVDMATGVITINPQAYTAGSKNNLGHFQETGAHELAHTQLHWEDLEAGRELTPEQEDQAWIYARIFCLPRNWLLHDPQTAWVAGADRRRQERYSARLAERWGVSAGVMVIRLRELGVVAPARTKESGLALVPRTRAGRKGVTG